MKKSNDTIKSLERWLRCNPHAQLREKIIAKTLLDELTSLKVQKYRG